MPTGLIEPTEAIDNLGPILSQYASDTARVLERDGRPVSRVQVSPTPVAWDSCCPDGTAYSRIISILPQTGQQQAPGSPGPCGVMFWTANLAVGVLRCAATLTGRGNAPSPERITEDGLAQALDLQSMKDAILSNEHTRAITNWLPLAPQGGCLGGEWQFNVRLPVGFVPLPDP